MGAMVRSFEAYLEAIEAETFTQKKKCALLRHSLGTEGREVLKHLPLVEIMGEGDASDTVDMYASAIKMLETRFKKKRNVIMERHKFYMRKQLPNESVEVFVSDLRALAATCEYGNFHDEMLRDQLVEKTNSRRTQEKLLTIPELTLDKALEIAKNIEVTTLYMDQMSLDAKVHAVFRDNVVSTRFDKRKIECYRCGSKNHLDNAPFCPAFDKICTKC